MANLERREISNSTALRIRSARFSLASRTSSMRLSIPSGRRTSIGFTFIGGRPMRGSVADTGYAIKSSQKAISLIDTIPDIAYGCNISNGRDKMATIEHRDGIWFLTIPGREAPMGFFSREGAVSFASNNLRLRVG